MGGGASRRRQKSLLLLSDQPDKNIPAWSWCTPYSVSWLSRQRAFPLRAFVFRTEPIHCHNAIFRIVCTLTAENRRNGVKIYTLFLLHMLIFLLKNLFSVCEIEEEKFLRTGNNTSANNYNITWLNMTQSASPTLC